MEWMITENDVREFEDYLRLEEKSKNTIEKYIRDVTAFWAFIGSQNVTKEMVIQSRTSPSPLNIEEAIICHVDSKGNETQLEFTKTEEDTVAVSTRMLGTFVIASPALLKEEVTAKNAPLRAPATMIGAADAKYYTDRTGNIGVSSEGFTDATANLSLYAGSLYDSTLIVGGIHAEGCF